MQDFVLSMAFSEDQDFFTEFAGIRTTSLDFIREFKETDDLSQDDRLFIPETGKKYIDIVANGVTNLEPEFFKRVLIDIFNKGSLFRAIIENTQIKITGRFIITEINFSESFESNCEFSIMLKNSGPYTITRK